jgi:mannose-1-phosphate guanylyltransferase/mannose-6-phosphate isomerase
MIVVIIAGGSGSRLWPLSTPTFPKQLLKVNGDKRSLLQNTYDRARKLTDAGSIYVVPEVTLMPHVKEQLPEFLEDNFVIEPARRGTAHCILAALDHISKKHDVDEPIAVLSADHYIRDVKGFVHSFKVAATTSKKEGRIVLVGVEPNQPATGFGYIQKDGLIDEDKQVFNVHSFKEKPDYKTAQRYVKSGNYLWNCGYFVGSINTFRDAMQTDAPQLMQNYEKLQQATSENYEETYLQFDSISIDYALIEKVHNLLVVPASFDWMDLGSFSDLHKAADLDEAGNNTQGLVELEEVENSFIQNLEDKPVAVIGLDNVVVVNTPDGILVARKDLSQKVGDVSKRFKKEN